jgi:hypothetical protein
MTVNEITPRIRLKLARKKNNQIKRMLTHGEINHYATFTALELTSVIDDLITVIDGLLVPEVKPIPMLQRLRGKGK